MLAVGKLLLYAKTIKYRPCGLAGMFTVDALAAYPSTEGAVKAIHVGFGRGPKRLADRVAQTGSRRPGLADRVWQTRAKRRYQVPPECSLPALAGKTKLARCFLGS